MKRFLKVVAWGLGVVVVLIALGLAYLFMSYPDVGPVRDLTVTATPERLARGAYLANHVSVCIDCHSTRDWTYFAGPIVPGTEGKGGELFDETIGYPGMIYAHNITPAGLGSQSDGVLYRAITTGVDKNGRAMFPIMPYPHFNTMSEEDILSIIAYIRALKPIENNPPQTVLNAPMNFIVRTIPMKRTPQPDPDTSNTYEYGKYLVNAASCADCHTQQVKGKPLPGMDFAGGFKFPFPGGAVARSANITPDEETGIGAWSESDFVSRFKFYDNAEARTLKPEAVGYNTVMPWTTYAGMTERDLAAIYKYLRTVAPVKNEVEKYTEASK
jgi:mono/diheme cytochrome c family protein